MNSATMKQWNDKDTKKVTPTKKAYKKKTKREINMRSQQPRPSTGLLWPKNTSKKNSVIVSASRGKRRGKEVSYMWEKDISVGMI